MINIIINPIQWCRDLIKSTVSSTLYPAVSSYSFGGIQIQSINFTQWNGPMLFKCWINKVIFLSMLLWINVSKHYHCIHCCRNSVFQMGNPVLVPLTPPFFRFCLYACFFFISPAWCMGVDLYRLSGLWFPLLSSLLCSLWSSLSFLYIVFLSYALRSALRLDLLGLIKKNWLASGSVSSLASSLPA